MANPTNHRISAASKATLLSLVQQMSKALKVEDFHFKTSEKGNPTATTHAIGFTLTGVDTVLNGKPAKANRSVSISFNDNYIVPAEEYVEVRQNTAVESLMAVGYSQAEAEKIAGAKATAMQATK